MSNEFINIRKHRLVKPVDGLDIHRKLRDFQREEQNMFYLRYPYLTQVSNIVQTKYKCLILLRQFLKYL